VLDNKLKEKKIGSFKCLYVVLILRFLDHFEVDVSNEIEDFVDPNFEAKTKVLKQMGYVEAKDGNGWIEKQKDSTTNNIEKQMKPFAEMLLAKMDELMRVQKEDYKEWKKNVSTPSLKD